VALEIMDVETKIVTTLYEGDYTTSAWEWIDDATVRVYVHAGAGIRAYRDIDITAGIPFVAADHADPEFWTPERTLR